MSGIISDSNHNWILEVLYNANKADTETYRVYKCLSRYIYQDHQFIGFVETLSPTTIRMKPLNDLADDCFFSVAFFSDFIHNKSCNTGSPDIQFYTHTGKSAYAKIGYRCISNHWDFWISYLNKNISL